MRGDTCNIDCLYCYEKRKETPGGARLSADDAGRLTTIFGDRPVAVELHGGEPLTIGRAYFAEMLDRLAAQPNVVRVSIQTNALLLDDAWLDLIDAHYPNLEIGVSLDGDAESNAWRIGYDGRPTYDRVAAALNLLATRGKHVGVITVVTSAVLNRAVEILDHLAGFAAVRAVNLVPCFDAADIAPTRSVGVRVPASRQLQQAALTVPDRPAWATTPGEYASFVLSATAHWISSGLFERIKLEPAVSAIQRLTGASAAICHFSAAKCDHVFTAYPDGRLGSCDELPGPQAQLAMLPEVTEEADLIRAQRQLPLLTAGRSLMVKCASCRYRDTCGGGCVATRWRAHQHSDSDDEYCAYRMRLIDGVAALLAEPHRPGAISCRAVRWRPRLPNSMPDVAGFLDRWDDPSRLRPTVILRPSEHGNINSAGLPGIHPADDLDPQHPQWRDGIEPAVWPLIDLLTRRLGYVTYDSCQGHRYTDLDLAPVGLRVGVLPRDRIESAQLSNVLCRLHTRARQVLPAACELLVGRDRLTSEATNRQYPVLDLALAPTAGWDEYFATLNDAVAAITGAMDDIARDARADCECRS
ncbi:radical SAM protein [Micromonospora sp. NPDC005324]|uniref:radical SAM/SPASM domain-containing protein n=1 Tax=Micromonospora sp. NPDC005324 TaxID=3157033 RepID=UPI0033B0A21E